MGDLGFTGCSLPRHRGKRTVRHPHPQTSVRFADAQSRLGEMLNVCVVRVPVVNQQHIRGWSCRSHEEIPSAKQEVPSCPVTGAADEGKRSDEHVTRLRFGFGLTKIVGVSTHKGAARTLGTASTPLSGRG